jgi:hypothetical protein
VGTGLVGSAGGSVGSSVGCAQPAKTSAKIINIENQVKYLLFILSSLKEIQS